MRNFVFLFIFIFVSAGRALPVLGIDDIPWVFHTKSKVVAVGDIHGDYQALRFILEQNKLIDGSGKWIGGAAHLVLNGDLISYGNESKKVLDYVIELQTEAKKQSGYVHALLGNHEIAVSTSNFKYMNLEDKTKFTQNLKPHAPYSQDNLLRVFSGNSKYATWFRSLNSIIKINGAIFVHAGLSEWALDTNIRAINSTVRAWLHYYQNYYNPDGVAPAKSPDPLTKWVLLPGKAPMWTSDMADQAHDLANHSHEYLSIEKLDQILKYLEAEVVISGHIMTRDRKIAMHHSVYGPRVIQTDTGNSSYYGGKLSSLVLNDGPARPWHSERSQIPSFCFSHF